METRANYILVGLFTVAVLIISFGFVYWSANVSDQDSRTTLLVRIEGSVSGLSQGSQVLFNGLNVGTVTNLRIDPNNPRVVIATTQVDRTTPITTSTTASLGSQGLTGLSFIGLGGGNVNDRNIIQSALEQGATPIITANPSDVTDILATARDIAERANNILSEFENLVQAVGPAVRTTADNVARTSGNVETFTASLAANSDQIDDFIGSLSRLSNSANTVAERLPGLIDQVGTFVTALNVGAVNQSIENVAAITQAVRGQTDNIVAAVDSISTAAQSFGAIGDAVRQNTPSIQAFLGRLGPISETASSVATRLDSTLANVDQITAAVNPDQIRTTIGNVTTITDTVRGQTQNIASAVESVASAASSFGAVGETIRQNTPSIQDFLGRLGPISQTASSVATRLDSTLENVDQITAAVNPDEVRSTIGNVSGFTDALNQQSGKLGSVVSGADTVLATLNSALTGLNGTRARIDEILTGIDPQDVSRAVTNVSSATTNIASAADSVRGVADGIGARRGDIDTIITNAEDTSANLKVASAQVQTLINSVNGMVNSPDGQGLTAEARATLQSIRQTAQTIQSAVGPISANLQSFSGQGLKDLQNLIRETTRAVSRIEGAVTDLSANPSRILFGGDGSGEVRQFDGRTRR